MLSRVVVPFDKQKNYLKLAKSIHITFNHHARMTSVVKYGSPAAVGDFQGHSTHYVKKGLPFWRLWNESYEADLKNPKVNLSVKG